MKKFIMIFFSGIIVLNLAGCESFTRKFTRKPKKTDQAVEMVLVPEEYNGPNMTKEELYRQYFTYWKSWQDELINALTQNSSLKKKLDCAQEAIKNLVNMRSLMIEQAQKNLDVYIARSQDLLSDMQSDTYGMGNNRNRLAAERVKSDIQRGFIYPKVKNYLR
ncbi:hypothetical protein EPN54_01600 [bacterium]|nr:MAG: hypothetical protein EPN54_01600 [bacterium]